MIRRWFYLRYGNRSLRERLTVAIAWRLPRSLAYWSAIRVMAHATQVPEAATQEVGSVTIPEVLQRWPR